MGRRFNLIALACAAQFAHAWVGRGHAQIADIAWTRLEPEVKKEIGEILKAGEGDFRPVSDVEAEVRKSFRNSAVWADWVKEHQDGAFEEWVKVWNAKFQPGYDSADANREAHRCKRWHYFDLPVRFKGVKPGVEGSNALIAMTTARFELAALGREQVRDRKAQCWWLYWLEHVTGDLHQPLHCASSFEFEPGGDAGGNLFRLGTTFPDNPERKSNLHFYWDQGIDSAIALESEKPQDVESVTARWILEVPPFEVEANDSNVANWIAAGAKMADDYVYSGVVRDGKPSEEYRAKLAKLCKRQAVLAGFRLANEINRALGG